MTGVSLYYRPAGKPEQSHFTKQFSGERETRDVLLTDSSSASMTRCGYHSEYDDQDIVDGVGGGRDAKAAAQKEDGEKETGQ